MADKESVRSSWRETYGKIRGLPKWGQAAEKLRNLPQYRETSTVFVTPSPSLHQARINCLIDGKNLVMPAPSLREGFFILPARSVPFRELSMAVTHKGLVKNGILLKNDAIPTLSVGFLLTDSLAVDQEGGRIGDGNGFFDLTCGLLFELGGLRQEWAAWTLILEEQVSQVQLPQDFWDIKMTGAITPAGIHTFSPPPQKPQIFWDNLTMGRIKRIDPLWKIYSSDQKR